LDAQILFPDPISIPDQQDGCNSADMLDEAAKKCCSDDLWKLVQVFLPKIPINGLDLVRLLQKLQLRADLGDDRIAVWLFDFAVRCPYNSFFSDLIA